MGTVHPPGKADRPARRRALQDVEDKSMRNLLMRRIQPWQSARFGRVLGSALLATIVPLSALAEEAAPALPNVGPLPDELSPWSMFLHADIVVKAVIIGLALASVATWTVL